MKIENRFPGLDGLRAAACLLVIFHHVAQRLDIYSQHFILQHIQLFFLMGNTGVSFFFVLSGFLLSYPFWKNYISNLDFPDIANYAKRRAARIMPGYYASFAVSIILALLFIPDMDYFARRLITGLTFTAGFHYTTLFPSFVNSPLWSISFEVFSYLLMPLFMFGLFRIAGEKRSFKKGIIYWIFALILIIGINQLIHMHLTPDNVKRGWEFGVTGGSKWWMPNYNPIGFFGHFAFGIIASGICAYFIKNKELRNRIADKNIFDIASIISSAAIIGLLCYVRTEEEFTHSLQKQPYYFPYLTALIAILSVSLVNSKFTGKLFDSRFMRFTAKISFGLYIWHYVIIALISFYVLPEYMNYMAIKDWRLWAGASFLMIVLSYGAATLSFHFIEKPFIDRIQKVREKVFKTKRKIRPGKLLSAFLLCVLALLFIFPLLWLLDASLRPPLEVMQSPPAIFQQSIWKSIESYTRDSYLAAFWHFDVGRALFNSIIVSSGTIFLTAIVVSLYAYALVFMEFKHKKFFLILALSTMMIPANALMIPMYKVAKNLHLLNSWFGLILPGAVSGFGVFLLRQYFLKIPLAVIEAARMDGAGHLRIWWHIILPLARPALAALAIIQFRIVWNDFLNPVIIMRDEKLMTLPVRILLINDTGSVLAAGFISIIIPLILFLKFHRQFTEGLTEGLHK